jgi:hypothetical protein
MLLLASRTAVPHYSARTNIDLLPLIVEMSTVFNFGKLFFASSAHLHGLWRVQIDVVYQRVFVIVGAQED